MNITLYASNHDDNHVWANARQIAKLHCVPLSTYVARALVDYNVKQSEYEQSTVLVF